MVVRLAKVRLVFRVWSEAGLRRAKKVRSELRGIIVRNNCYLVLQRCSSSKRLASFAHLSRLGFPSALALLDLTLAWLGDGFFAAAAAAAAAAAVALLPVVGFNLLRRHVGGWS